MCLLQFFNQNQRKDVEGDWRGGGRKSFVPKAMPRHTIEKIYNYTMQYKTVVFLCASVVTAI